MRWIIPVLCARVLVTTCTRARAYRLNEPPSFGAYSKAYVGRQAGPLQFNPA